ncbi:MAG: hypothetical protein HYZ29_28220 [Myxococcales bacterium]|nr:hypothetical protein [Myxococcales bacterium]
MSAPARQVGDRPFLVDAGAIALISLFICLFSQRLAWMTWLVPAVIVARLVLWLRLPRAERDLDGRAEVVLLALTTVLGAFNDWNSVTRHRVYDYTVPTDLPGLSHIPIWMLLYWGLILRFVLTVFHWRRVALPRTAGGVGRVAFLLALVLGTRQAIYRLYAHPLLSWLPFLLALAVLLWVVRPDPGRLRLLAVVLVVGPAIEALYIQVGQLHAYRLGWLAGVPIWIALWWGLAALVWDDLGTRLMDAIESWLAPAPAPALRS